MKAHEADLRAEVEREREGQETAGNEPRDATAFAADIAAQGSEAAHGERLRALLQFAERLALQPGQIEETHVVALREVGLDDRAIHDAVQAVAYFSYINRVADGLGVDLEPEMR